jgi:hypothetical protein
MFRRNDVVIFVTIEITVPWQPFAFGIQIDQLIRTLSSSRNREKSKRKTCTTTSSTIIVRTQRKQRNSNKRIYSITFRQSRIHLEIAFDGPDSMLQATSNGWTNRSYCRICAPLLLACQANKRSNYLITTHVSSPYRRYPSASKGNKKRTCNSACRSV